MESKTLILTILVLLFGTGAMLFTFLDDQEHSFDYYLTEITSDQAMADS
jgi:hypothetical protein